MVRSFRAISNAFLRYVILALLIVAVYQMFLLNYHGYVWSRLMENVVTSSLGASSHPEELALDSHSNKRNAVDGKTTLGKPALTLVVGILSQLKAVDRRDAIRMTWLTVCDKNTDIVACKFFTDPFANNSDQRVSVERKVRKDIEYMPIRRGFNFAMRLVWMLQYFTDRYQYDFFLRVDDDYFICLERLLHELPYRQSNGLYWGYIHCQPNIVRVDEGFMILSRDIILEALGKVNTTLQCHAFGDQAVAMWLQDSKLNITYFADNSRVIHEVTSYRGKTYQRPEMCENYIGLHGTYPEYMRRYWQISEAYKRSMLLMQHRIPKIKEFETICHLPKFFDYRFFAQPFYEPPILCKYNPTFRNSVNSYGGRQALGH